jgi:membrane protein DedA with SNARE-associated domain
MEFVDAWANQALQFIGTHADWAGPVVLLLAFGESLAFLSLLLPATVVLIGAGGLVGAGVLSFWTLFFWAVPGAFLGDAVSYWVGRSFGGSIVQVWPFRGRPEMLDAGRRFFVRHGGKSVFIGRFFGPMRAVVPLVAGMLGMPRIRFQVYNFTSALLWVPALLAPGAFVGWSFDKITGFDMQNLDVSLVVAAAVVFVAGMAFAWWRRSRRDRSLG